MIVIFQPHWIIIGVSILIAIIAYKKNRSPIVFGALNCVIAFGIAALFVYIDPMYHLWFEKMGMSLSSLYMFSSFTVAGGLFGYLSKLDVYDDEYYEDEEEAIEEQDEESNVNESDAPARRYVKLLPLG